ncbi:DUF6192 family protein [Streptomyces chartreusis]
MDLIGACQRFVAAADRLVPSMRGRRLSEDERELIRRKRSVRRTGEAAAE